MSAKTPDSNLGMPLNTAFWDNVVSGMDHPKVEDIQYDAVVQPTEVERPVPKINDLAAKAKRIGLCGAINTERVCVRPDAHAGRHEARFLGGPKDGQVIHHWPNVFKAE